MRHVAQPDFDVYFYNGLYNGGFFLRMCSNFSTSAITLPDSSLTATVNVDRHRHEERIGHGTPGNFSIALRNCVIGRCYNRSISEKEHLGC
jgi:hypothetical protein